MVLDPLTCVHTRKEGGDALAELMPPPNQGETHQDVPRAECVCTPINPPACYTPCNAVCGFRARGVWPLRLSPPPHAQCGTRGLGSLPRVLGLL